MSDLLAKFIASAIIWIVFAVLLWLGCVLFFSHLYRVSFSEVAGALILTSIFATWIKMGVSDAKKN